MDTVPRHRTAEALADLGRLLSRTLDRDVIAERVAECVRALLATRLSVVFRLGDEPGALVAMAVAGAGGPFRRGFVVPPGVGVSGLAVRERRPIATADILADPRITLADRVRADLETAGVRAAMAAPLIVHDHVIGALAVGDRGGRTFGDDDMRLIQIFADQAALAVEAARLLEEADRRRRQAEAAERRSAFLDEVGRVLGSSLDYDTTLARIARLAVPDLADLCAVDVLEDNGAIRRLAAASGDASSTASAREFHGASARDAAVPSGTRAVLRTGRPEFHPRVSDELLATMAGDEQHLQLLRALGIRSLMVLPLAARGRVVGAITLCTAESGRQYGLADIAFAEDLARRAAQAVDNADLYRQAQEANRAKDDFLATVSHELRTPLTAILGWARVLRARGYDEATSVRALETIERNARAQAQIVDDLLDVSRIITGKFRLHVRPLDLAEVIAEAIEAVRPAVDAKAIRLSTRLDDSAGPFVGDPDRIRQVVWNLLSNATKFTPPGGPIDVLLGRAGAQAEITVRDTGRGIKPDLAPYVFDRFRQGDSATTRSATGLGLGLAIVRHIVELHGGTVHVDSPGEGQGATFTVRLPLTAALLRAGDVAAAAPPVAADRPARLLTGHTVLVVEDEADMRNLLDTVLRDAGAAVMTASSAAAADAAFGRNRPDVLVCDIGMPVEDGYSLMERLRRANVRVPAVALTAYARPEDRQRALQAGFDVHLAKPVDPAALVAVVADLARSRAAA